MALYRTTLGTPATWSIGRAGEPADHWAARTVDHPRIASLKGQMVEVVTVIALKKNQAGEMYTSQRLVNTAFLTDRNTRCEALDGEKGSTKPIADLIAEHANSVAAFRSANTSELSVDALTALVD